MTAILVVNAGPSRARRPEIIDEHTAQLGFTVGVRFAGPLDPGPDEALAHDILAVTREALSNCARHAHATAVTISLMLQDGLIPLGITDNGCGLGTPAPAACPACAAAPNVTAVPSS